MYNISEQNRKEDSENFDASTKECRYRVEAIGIGLDMFQSKQLVIKKEKQTRISTETQLTEDFASKYQATDVAERDETNRQKEVKR